MASASVVEEPFNHQNTRSPFEKLAAQMPYLSPNAALYRNCDSYFQVANPDDRKNEFLLLGQVTDRIHPAAALRELLTHPDPKVRTLSAVALFDRDDPAVLPALVALATDPSPTFDGHPPLNDYWLTHTGIGPPPRKQTVGEMATRMVNFYLMRSGFHYGIKHPTERGFAEYWQARQNRLHCAGWFAVQLARASKGISPAPVDSHTSIQALRRRIDKLPTIERTWVLLFLNGEDGSDALVTEKQLVTMCQNVGPEKLLLLLQNKIPSDDPDLHPRPNNNWPYKRMSLFILRHAERLLRPRDSTVLLDCEQWHRDYLKHRIVDPTITAWWSVAAARLQPTKAGVILRSAMDRFQGEYQATERSLLCVALWQLKGTAATRYVLDWFYNETPETATSPNSRGKFIQGVGATSQGKEILARLIQDPRFVQTDWQSLRDLITTVNKWTTTPVVTGDELSKAWHPLGMHFDMRKALADQPVSPETQGLLAHLSEWRQRLRASVPIWYAEK